MIVNITIAMTILHISTADVVIRIGIILVTFFVVRVIEYGRYGTIVAEVIRSLILIVQALLISSCPQQSLHAVNLFGT